MEKDDWKQWPSITYSNHFRSFPAERIGLKKRPSLFKGKYPGLHEGRGKENFRSEGRLRPRTQRGGRNLRGEGPTRKR